MCFSQPMSACLATAAFALAYYEHKTIQCPMYTIAIMYYGLMETLQMIQYSYVAEPDDGYSMCENRMNQTLTFLGGLRIAFQPLVTNLMFSFWRKNNIVDRIEHDMAQRLSILAGLWLLSRYILAVVWPENPDMVPQATEACPNYEWLQAGHDGVLNFTTPNLPGHSCTFRPPTEMSHLAWAIPLYQSTYFMPGVSLHFFMFFAPLIVNIRRPLVMRLGIIGVLIGPYFTSKLTSSLNEQPAIWCFFSVIELLALSLCAHVRGYHLEETPQTLVHQGGLGEQPLEYVLVDTSSSSAAPLVPMTPRTKQKFFQAHYTEQKSGWLGSLSNVRISVKIKSP